MKSATLNLLILFIFLPFVTTCIEEQGGDLNIPYIYLTWQSEDTSTTMTVNYITTNSSKNSQVFYDQKSHVDDVDAYAFSATGKSSKINELNWVVNSIEITNLKPNQTYYFTVGAEDSGYSQEMKFRTLPDDETPIRFFQGGDMNDSREIISIAESALNKDPMAILIGGDIAYGNGHPSRVSKWKDWFERIKKSIVTPKGFLVPLILAIGNHEVNGKQGPPIERSPYFLKLFPQNKDSSYFTRRLGEHSVLFVLDSGHLTDAAGEQAEWLEKEFIKYQGVSNKLALYHIPLYPSAREFEESRSQKTREAWLHIFDKYNLDVAFENHDHALKRTYLLRGGQSTNEGGTLYVGDGCWGKNTREITEKWYLHKAQSKKHVWSVVLDEKRLQFKALGEHNRVFDQFVLNTIGENRVEEQTLQTRAQ